MPRLGPSFWNGMRLTTRFMMIVGAGLITLIAGVVAVIAWFEQSEMERQLRALSVNEMTSLHALILNVMDKRPEDGDNIGIQVFNNWFDSRNADYPGEVWSAWGPKVRAFMADTEPNRSPKLPRDEVDEEAFSTKMPVSRIVGNSYRYAYPIVLGVTQGADREVCYNCHGSMDMGKGDVIAVLSSSLSTAEATAKLHAVLTWLIVSGLVATALAVLGVRTILDRLIGHPIDRMAERMSALAEGDDLVDIPGLERRDEVGKIARAVQVFKTNAIAKHAMEEEMRADAVRRDARMAWLEQLIGNFEAAVANVLESVAANAETMTDSARRMVACADVAAGRAGSAAQHANEASENVRMVASAADELSTSIHEIAERVTMSNAVATSATHEANGVNGRVHSLSQSADKIGEVIALISDIAEKTNLLALNATVEAARAGAGGKGFAVVAGEVKNLARRTVMATEEISLQVCSIQSETNNTVMAIRGISSTVSSMDDITSAIAAAVEEQGAATQEIARNIEHAAVGTHGVYRNIAEVNASIRETDQAAREVLAAVESMRREAATLQSEVDRFLADIRV